MSAFFDFNGKPVKDMQVQSLTARNANFYNMASKIRGLTDAVEELSDLLITAPTSLPSNTTPESKTSFNGLVWRTLDGTGNNLIRPQRGSAEELLLRKSSADYGVGDVAVRGTLNPNPRVVSNSICKGISPTSTTNLSDITWIWGQFVDHELTLTHTQEGLSPETLPMVTDPLDPNEDFGSPVRTIPFTRSQFEIVSSVRQQPNSISAYIDATNVYGTSTERGYELRRLDGTGKLKTSVANNGESLMPYNVSELPNASPTGSTPSDFFLAGDVRANENSALIAMHTVFVREHNRLCDDLVTQVPALVGQDELIYQQARRMVVGIMQQITYGEYLPALLGSFPSYTGYDPTTDAGIATEFSTVGYRIGHTMVSANLQVGTNPASVVALRDVFFTPSYVQTNGINDLLVGASNKLQQEIDGIVVPDLQTFLFGPPTLSMLHDLPALNIQRGRDHGIPGYNALRVAYGLSSISSFSNLPCSVANQNKLQALYDTVNDIDPWVGCIVENHVPGSSVGPLIRAILVDQFDRLRRGDRFWYEIDPGLSSEEKLQIKNTTFSQVLSRNVPYIFSNDVFHV